MSTHTSECVRAWIYWVLQPLLVRSLVGERKREKERKRVSLPSTSKVEEKHIRKEERTKDALVVGVPWIWVHSFQFQSGKRRKTLIPSRRKKGRNTVLARERKKERGKRKTRVDECGVSGAWTDGLLSGFISQPNWSPKFLRQECGRCRSLVLLFTTEWN